MTALYVTHDQAEAVVLGDRIGVMRDGVLLQLAPPEEIYNRPADIFVANFTGATNEIAGRVLERNGDTVIVDIGGHRLEATAMQPIRPGDAVRITLRPENIGLGRVDARNSFTVRVLDRRYQGTQTVYDIDFSGRRLEVLELGTAARFDAGTEAPMSMPRESLWAFHDTGSMVVEPA